MEYLAPDQFLFEASKDKFFGHFFPVLIRLAYKVVSIIKNEVSVRSVSCLTKFLVEFSSWFCI